jgi:hypothetical protein
VLIGNTLQVFVGQLPSDFLRINTATASSQQQQQEAADQQAALALQQQMVGVPYVQNATGRLSITVAQVISHTVIPESSKVNSCCVTNYHITYLYLFRLSLQLKLLDLFRRS